MPSPIPRVARIHALGAVLALGGVAPAAAQASHRVTIVVPEVGSLAVSSAPVRLAFARPAPGEPFADVTDATAAYAVTVNTAGNKITGALDAAYDEGLRLSVRLAPPPGARSLGVVGLGPASRDLVADVSEVAASGLGIAYTASVESGASPSGVEATRTVTFTITGQ